MSKQKILDSSGSDEEEELPKLKVNEDFAKVFNRYREKEEFQRLKNKYGEEAATSKLSKDLQESDDDSSSSEEEDEEAEKWTEEHEKDFFKTLSNLKRKDAKIYDGTTSFFKPMQEKGAKSSKDKPMTLVDLERQVITEKEGHYEDLADEKLAEKLKDKTYVQEMNEIQQSLKKKAQDSSDEEESSDEADNFLVKKVKTDTEKAMEEEEYRQWLSGRKDHLEDETEEKELKSLKEFWNDKNLDEGEKFLRDYILNKKYLEDGDYEDDSAIKDPEDLSDDEKTLDQQEEFEHKYNFRFEDPDKEFIKKYPRTIQDSMRRKDESRKKKREEVKERKLKEKAKKREELLTLKSLKRKEILEKIERLRKITGNEELAFKDEDLEEDFDPDKYDERMNEIFDAFENAPIQAEDEEKPVFSDLESDLEVENWDEYEGPGGTNDSDEEENEESENETEIEKVGDVHKEEAARPSKSVDHKEEMMEASKGEQIRKQKLHWLRD